MDIEDVPNETVGLICRVAAIALLATAMVDAGLVAQIVLFARHQNAEIIVAEVGFGLLTLAHAYSGAQVYWGDLAWNALAVVVSAFGALAGVAWFVVLFFASGTVSPLALMASLASAVSLVLCLAALPASRRLWQARRLPD